MAVRSWRNVDWAAHEREARIEGVRVRYVDYGDGPPLLLVHGMAGSWESWLANIPALGDRYRVIAVDLPGFGASEALPEDEDFGGYVRLLEALLDELCVGAVGLVGHSLGGLVTLSLAAAMPHRVRCLVLVSGGGAELSALRLKAIQSVFWLFRLVLAVPGALRLIVTTPLGRLLLSPAVFDSRGISRDLLARMVPRTVGPGFMDAVRRGGEQLGELDLAQVVAPTLLVWGRQDRILPLAVAHDLATDLLEAHLVVLEDVGHCAMFEAPDACNGYILDFLGAQRLGRGSPAPGRAHAYAWLSSRPGGSRTERCGNDA